MDLSIATSEEAEMLHDKMDVFMGRQLSFQGNLEVFKNYVIKENGCVIAGIKSCFYLGTCVVINVLFVDDNHRHKGFGTQLLKKIEGDAKSTGFQIIHVDTFDFQAKDFYLKAGYEIFGVLEDCPPGHRRYYMKKNLNECNAIIRLNHSDQDFYDQLAPLYHLLFEDWDASMHKQGTIISGLIPSTQIAGAVLDCACGIGTQTLPLAALGYEIEGIDLSFSEIKRAKMEAELRNLKIHFRQDDMRELKTAPLHYYGLIMAMDNALPHLNSDEEIATALKAMKERLKGGGLLLISVRDYDKLMKERPTMTPPQFFQEGQYRRIVHQVWDWHDDRHYTLHLYITRDTPNGCKSHHFLGKYRAARPSEIASIAESVGFIDVKVLGTEDTGFYQPMIQGRVP